MKIIILKYFGRDGIKLENKMKYIKLYNFRKAFFIFTGFNLLLLAISALSTSFIENNNKIVFISFSLWCTLFIYYLLYETLKDNEEKIYYEYSMKVIFIIIIQVIFAYYLFYLGYEKFIRFWDYAAYWGLQVTNTNIFEKNVIEGLQALKHTIYYDEYNSFPTLFLHSIFHLTDKSKWAYILSVFIVYTIPLVVCFSKIFMYDIEKEEKIWSYLKFMLCIVVIVFFPNMHLPALQGCVDIIGLTFISMILLMMKNYDFSQINIKKMIIIGILLIMLFLSRRWYSYWIVSYFIALGISYFITDVIINRKVKMYLLKIKNIFIFGIILLSIVGIAFFPLLRRIFESNFAFAYSAYKYGGISYEVMQFINSLGIIPTIIMSIGMFVGIKDKKVRAFSIQLTIIPILCIIFFNHIQTMGAHHRYLLLASAIYFQGIGCISIVNLFKNKRLKNIFVFGLIIIYMYNFFVSIIGIETKGLFTNTFCKPIIMSSYNENYNIVNFVEEAYKETGEKTYILASSTLYNEAIISNYYMPDLRMTDMIYSVNCVDLRDGFPEQFLSAKYVIVVDPIQYHLRPEDQRTIGILAEALLNENSVKKHYTIEKIDKGSKGEKIYYFKQESKLDNEAIYFLIDEFNKYYKQYPNLFEERIIKYIE